MVADDRYRLAPLRDSRTREERMRKGDLASAASEARETEQVVARASERARAAAESLANALRARDAATSLVERQLAERFCTRRRRDLADARAEELRARIAHDTQLGAVDEARLVLARARADREVIERHFAAWREQQRKLADRRAD